MYANGTVKDQFQNFKDIENDFKQAAYIIHNTECLFYKIGGNIKCEN